MAGNNAELFDQAFDEFVARDNLPELDYIYLHGVWSWISDENRTLIVNFIRRELKVGGVLYLSYNTLPSWAAFAPIRHLMADTLEAGGVGTVSRVDAALSHQTFWARHLDSGLPGCKQTPA